MARLGLELPRETMANWYIKCAPEYFQPVYTGTAEEKTPGKGGPCPGKVLGVDRNIKTAWGAASWKKPSTTQ